MVGNMTCPQSPSGNMPVGQELQLQGIGGISTAHLTRIINQVVLAGLLKLVATLPTPGAFMICWEMYGNGHWAVFVHTQVEVLQIQSTEPVGMSIIGEIPGSKEEDIYVPQNELFSSMILQRPRAIMKWVFEWCFVRFHYLRLTLTPPLP